MLSEGSLAIADKNRATSGLLLEKRDLSARTAKGRTSVPRERSFAIRIRTGTAFGFVSRLLTRFTRDSAARCRWSPVVVSYAPMTASMALGSRTRPRLWIANPLTPGFSLVIASSITSTTDGSPESFTRFVKSVSACDMSLSARPLGAPAPARISVSSNSRARRAALPSSFFRGSSALTPGCGMGVAPVGGAADCLLPNRLRRKPILAPLLRLIPSLTIPRAEVICRSRLRALWRCCTTSHGIPTAAPGRGRSRPR